MRCPPFRATSAYVELKIYKTDISLSGAVIKPYISFDGNEYCPLGIFYASEINKDKVYIDITAYDKMALLNEKYEPAISLPNNTANVLADIASQYNFSLKSFSVFEDNVISSIECTVREMLGYLAGLNGANAKFNRDGKLDFIFYSDSGVSLSDEVFLDGQTDAAENEYTISAVISGEGENEYKSGNGKGIIFANPFVNQTIIDKIKNKILPFSYMASSVKYRGNPAIEIGDIITVIDTDSNSYKIPVMSQEFEFNGGLSATIESYGISDEMDIISNFQSNTVELNRKVTMMEQIQSTILGASGGYYELLLDESDNNRPYGTAW